MDIKDFAKDFLEQALLNVETEGLSQEDAITRDILEYITDSSEAFEPELCPYKIKGIKINAYDYDDDENALSLFVTIPKLEPNHLTVSDSDVEDAFKKGLKLFKETVSGKLFDKVEESNEQVFELLQIIKQIKDEVKTIRTFILTNGRANPEIIPQNFEESGIFYEHQLWDIERLFQHDRMRSGKQKIEIDLLNNYNTRLRCIKMESISDSVDVFLTIISGKLLAKIYGEFRQGLLEKNVRTFLQFKAKVNKGIRETIKAEPELFLAYNNGISTTAEDVSFSIEDGYTYITKIDNWQIVNGGQTTASLYTTSQEKDTDLSKVFVQMKISVIKEKESMDEIVSNISRYANSQTAVKDSDFSSNNPYHVAIENFSRNEWIPANTGGRATAKWFYERTRGQFLDEQSKRVSSTDLNKFKKEYPKENKFAKADLAKYEMSWLQQPYVVSMGAEKNFLTFTREFVNHLKNEVTKTYYQSLIGKVILFKAIDRLVYKKALGGYKANMVAYIIALLSYKSKKRLNLEKIWENQEISKNLADIIDKLIPIVWEHINNPQKAGMNIGEWCKKSDCWSSLKDKTFDIDDLMETELSESNNTEGNDLIGQDLTPQEIKIIENASSVLPEVYAEIAKWAKHKAQLTPFDRKLIHNIGIVLTNGGRLTLKQAKNALRIQKLAVENGFTE